MNHNESWTILELEEGSTSEAVEAAFSRRNADLAQRIAAAATPGLRQKYEQQAERLRQARDRLLGNGHSQRTPAPLSLTKQSDLPARTPMATGVGRRAESGRDRVPSENSTGPEDIRLTLTQQRDLAAVTPIRSFGGGVSSDSAPPAAALGISAGQVLAERYEVRDHLGSGGMGAVFAAFDRVRDEEIAIKVLLPHLLTDPKARERFLSEARIASSLSHPNIVRVFDVHQTVGLTFLTMERLRGRSLREDIARRQQTAERFSVAEVRGIAMPVCEALQTAHGQTVHRDVKPENIWMGEDGTVKLMDFGIARLLRPSQFTSTGLALGTAYYMAPEQLRGQEVDHRADQFALGVILYELLTGEIPQGAIKAPHVMRRSVPSGMSDAVMRALEGRPEARHVDMAALGRALASRSKRWVGMRVVVAATVAILLGAIAALPVLRTPTAGAPDDSPFAREIRPASAGTKAAYHAQRSQVEELKKQADAVEAQIESEAKSSPSGTAGQVAELWRRHPQRREWQVQAEKSLASAKDLTDKSSFEQANEDLKTAEAEYRKPQVWWTNARQALESIDKTRATLDERLSKVPGISLVLTAWPEKLEAEVERKLLQGGGEEGLAEARRVAAEVSKIEEALVLRGEVSKVGQGAKSGAQLEGFRERYEAAVARLQEADRTLVEWRLGAAGRLYTTAAEEFCVVLAELGKRYLEAKRFEEAAVQFGQIVALRPQVANGLVLPGGAGVSRLGVILAQAYLSRAETSAGRHDYDRAIADCDEAIGIDPKLATAYADRGMAYYRKADYDRAIADSNEAIRIDPKCAKAYSYRGGAYAQKGDDDRAMADYNEAIRLNPKCAVAYCGRGNAYAKKRDQDRAITEFNEAIRLDPKCALAYCGRGNAYAMKGDQDRAIADFSEAIRLDPKDAVAYRHRGIAYGNKGEHDRAIADFSDAIRVDPQSARAYNNRGLVYTRKGDQDRAIADYNEAIRLDPKLAEGYRNRGFAYAVKRDPDRAMADSNEAIRLDPKDAVAYVNRGVAHIKKGDPDRAMVDINEAIRLDPKLSIAYYSRGFAYGQKGDRDRAIADYNEAIRLNPKLALAYAHRGMSYAEKGDSDRAMADCNEAIRLDPKSAVAYYNRGYAFQVMGEKTASRADYDRAKQLGYPP